jgi:hypothetical protein
MDRAITPRMVALSRMASVFPVIFDALRHFIDKIFKGAAPAWRPPGGTADKTQPDHQSQECQGPRPADASDIAGARRRGDRIGFPQSAAPAQVWNWHDSVVSTL